ncbi:MAG: efflux RND transporter periplasmic adaptor subunit [Burkholderiaceae bacterium]
MSRLASLAAIALWAVCTPALAQTEVRTRPFGELATSPVREAPASVAPRNRSRISAETAAIIEKLPVDVGEPVAAGAVLAELDDRDARLALEQAQAQADGLLARLQLAESQLKRARDLKSDNFVTTETVSQRSAEVVGLRAERQAALTRVSIARRQLAKTVIRAPFDAVLAERQAQLGELTGPGSPLFTLVQTGGEEVRAAVPADLASSLSQAADPAFIHDGRAHPLRLLRLSPIVDQRSRTREARLVFEGPPPPTGSDGVLRWRATRLHLPASLIVRRDQGLGVFVVRDARAVFVPLPGAQEGRSAEARLTADERVVVQGQAALRDGERVRIAADGGQ